MYNLKKVADELGESSKHLEFRVTELSKQIPISAKKTMSHPNHQSKDYLENKLGSKRWSASAYRKEHSVEQLTSAADRPIIICTRCTCYVCLFAPTCESVNMPADVSKGARSAARLHTRMTNEPVPFPSSGKD